MEFSKADLLHVEYMVCEGWCRKILSFIQSTSSHLAKRQIALFEGNPKMKQSVGERAVEGDFQKDAATNAQEESRMSLVMFFARIACTR